MIMSPSPYQFLMKNRQIVSSASRQSFSPANPVVYMFEIKDKNMSEVSPYTCDTTRFQND